MTSTQVERERRLERSPEAPRAAASRPPLLPGLPVLGSALDLLRDTRALLVNGYRRFGPVFRLRIAWQRYTVIAGRPATDFMAEGLDEQHLSRHTIFDPIQDQFGRADLVLAQSGDRHTRLRAPLAIAYSRQMASPLVPALIDVVRDEVQRWPPGTSMSVTPLAARLAFLQYRRLLGPGAERLAFEDCRRVTDYGMNVGAGLLPALVFKTPRYRAAHRRAFGVLWDLVRDLRRRGPLAGHQAALLGALLHGHDAAGRPLTDDEAITYAAYGLAASIAYVGRHVAFMLYEILRSPELAGDVSAEVAGAFAKGVSDARDLRRLRILQSVYQETLRRHPISPGMPFHIDRDFEYGGWRFERGDTAVISPVPLAFDPESFHDPEAFDASRCREPRNEHLGGSCQPFGLGNRTCVATGLVEVMAVSLVATLLHTRSLVLEPPDYRLGLTVRPLPAPDRRCRVRTSTPREPAAAPPPPALEEEALASFPGHDAAEVREVLGRAAIRRFAPGVAIVREGEIADAFYLLQRGSAVVTRAAAQGQPLATLVGGDWFGEIGLLHDSPRNATVSAGPSGAETLVLDRESFLALVAASDLVASEIGALMQKRVAANRLRQLASRAAADAVLGALPDFVRQAFPPGEVILHEGDPSDRFYVLVDGEVDVSRRAPDGTDRPVARLGAGEYFGELGLLRGAPRNATITVAGPGPAVLLTTDRDGFARLLERSGGAGGELARGLLASVERLGYSP